MEKKQNLLRSRDTISEVDGDGHGCHKNKNEEIKKSLVALDAVYSLSRAVLCDTLG